MQSKMIYACINVKLKKKISTRSHTYVLRIPDKYSKHPDKCDRSPTIRYTFTHSSTLCIIHWSILRMPVIHSELSQSVILNNNDTNSIWNADYGIQNIGITHFDGQILTFDLKFYIDTLVTDVMILFELFAFLFFIRFDSFF